MVQFGKTPLDYSKELKNKEIYLSLKKYIENL